MLTTAGDVVRIHAHLLPCYTKFLHVSSRRIRTCASSFRLLLPPVPAALHRRNRGAHPAIPARRSLLVLDWCSIVGYESGSAVAGPLSDQLVRCDSASCISASPPPVPPALHWRNTGATLPQPSIIPRLVLGWCSVGARLVLGWSAMGRGLLPAIFAVAPPVPGRTNAGCAGPGRRLGTARARSSNRSSAARRG